MKTIALLFFLMVSASGYAEESQDVLLPAQGEKLASVAAAKISYFENCEKLRSELQGSALQPLVEKAACIEPAVQEGTRFEDFYRASGGLRLVFRRPLLVEKDDLRTGFVNSEAEANELWAKLCGQWKKGSDAKGTILFETCGEKIVDQFYVKPEILSTALRIRLIKNLAPRGEYCHCRSRAVEVVDNTPWGPRVRSKLIYDLMALVDAGYYERKESFSSREECQDEVVRQPFCSANP